MQGTGGQEELDEAAAEAAAAGMGEGVTGAVAWAKVDLNHRPHPYQGCALTELSYWPKCESWKRTGARVVARTMGPIRAPQAGKGCDADAGTFKRMFLACYARSCRERGK